MRRLRVFAFVAAFAGLLVSWQRVPISPEVAHAQNSNEVQAAFLIRFGVSAGAAEKWDGSLKIDGGRLVGLDPWQFDEFVHLVAFNRKLERSYPPSSDLSVRDSEYRTFNRVLALPSGEQPDNVNSMSTPTIARVSRPGDEKAQPVLQPRSAERRN